jgi:GNAT superfamily N-acetyltransferase
VIAVRVRVAQPHEAGTVLALVEALVTELGDEGREFTLIDREKLRDALSRELGAGSDPGSGSGRFLALLAVDESDTPIGVLTLSTSFAIYAGGEYGVIDEMYVRPEWRGQGVGRRLVEAAREIARRRSWFRLDVTGPAASDAARALRFYEGLGFEHTGPKMRMILAPSPYAGPAPD